MLKIVDLHCDTIGELQAGADMIAGHPSGHIDLRRLTEGGVGGQVFAAYISPVIPEEMTGCDAFPSLIEMMRAKGFSDQRIRKLSCENFCRVLQANP